jgi:hypothetical protein
MHNVQRKAIIKLLSCMFIILNNVPKIAQLFEYIIMLLLHVSTLLHLPQGARI